MSTKIRILKCHWTSLQNSFLFLICKSFKLDSYQCSLFILYKCVIFFNPLYHFVLIGSLKKKKELSFFPWPRSRYYTKKKMTVLIITTQFQVDFLISIFVSYCQNQHSSCSTISVYKYFYVKGIYFCFQRTLSIYEAHICAWFFTVVALPNLIWFYLCW